MSDNWTVERIYLQTGTTDFPGGQHAGLPHSAMRVTHVPTGLMAQCGAERSDHKNRALATEMVQWGLVSIGWQENSTSE